jgi:hypothetical protein
MSRLVVQGITGTPTRDGKLALSWIVQTEHHAVSVQVAFDPEFTRSARHLVLPKGVTSCALDLGTGVWFYRVGAWLGPEPNRGVIDWSGIYGPVLLRSPKGALGLGPETLKVEQIQSLESGMRFHTGRMEEYMVVVRYVNLDDKEEPRWVFVRDVGLGYLDILGISEKWRYTFTLFDCKGFPSEGILSLGEGLTIAGRRALPSGPSLSVGDYSEHKADTAILRDLMEKQSVRFSSQADYLKYVAAKAKTTGARVAL